MWVLHCIAMHLYPPAAAAAMCIQQQHSSTVPMRASRECHRALIVGHRARVRASSADDVATGGLGLQDSLLCHVHTL